MRLVTALFVGAALLVPSTASADNRRFTDRHDVKGLLDIAYVSEGHAPGAVVHALHTYRPFSSQILRGSNGIVFVFDIDGDSRIDRFAFLLWARGALRAVITDAEASPLGTAAVRRPDARTVSVRVPLGLLNRPDAYSWAAVTLYKGKPGCARVCHDIAPDQGLVSHRLVPLPRLSVDITGTGNVHSIPQGIDCPGQCTKGFRRNIAVTLVPNPADGWTFGGWSGACSGADDCTVTMTSAQSVRATFVPLRTLTIATYGGPGFVNVSPGDGHCAGGPCTFRYTSGTTIVLTAATGSEYGFEAWGADCTGTAPTCTLTMNGDKSVSARFAMPAFTLSVAIDAQDGSTGRVVSGPPGIDCPGHCAETYTGGVYITLWAAAGPQSVFRGWENSVWCQGTLPECTVPMGELSPGDKSVTASFGPPPPP